MTTRAGTTTRRTGTTTTAKSSAPGRSRRAAAPSWRGFLEGQTRERLIGLFEELAAQIPALGAALSDRSNLAAGNVKPLVASIRGEIQELDAEPDWNDEWAYGGEVDLGRLRERLEELAASGHADEVLDLGQELIEAGTRYVEQSHDDGYLSDQIASCMKVTFQALSHSSLPPVERMLWAVDAELQDEYELCQGTEAFWEREHAPEDWSLLADRLTKRLGEFKGKKGADAWSRGYRRDALSNWLIQALEKSGRDEEILPLCRREAKATGSYVRLVERLINAGRLDEAEEWIQKGIQATEAPWPGIAEQLRKALRKLRESEGDWLRAAALRGDDFFRRPGLAAYLELNKAAQRADVWPDVRAAASHYLETGELPRPAGRSKARRSKKKGRTAWPLPQTGMLDAEKLGKRQFPQTEALIQIAIHEKRPDDVLRWYDQRPSLRSRWPGAVVGDDRIAAAVVATHPDRAIAIWKAIAESFIRQTQVKAYETAAPFLGKMQQVLRRLGREGEWESYQAELRKAHSRKWRFLEVLDRLSGRRIIES